MHAKFAQECFGRGMETCRSGVIDAIGTTLAFYPYPSFSIFLHRRSRLGKHIVQLRIAAFKEACLHLIAVVTVDTLIGAYPQVAMTIGQQTCHRVAAQAVLDAQGLECILSCCYLDDE